MIGWIKRNPHAVRDFMQFLLIKVLYLIAFYIAQWVVVDTVAQLHGVDANLARCVWQLLMFYCVVFGTV